MIQICSNDYVMMEKEMNYGYNRVIENSKEKELWWSYNGGIT